MKRNKWLPVLLCLFWILFPGTGMAAERTETYVQVNPVYQGEISQGEIQNAGEGISAYTLPQTFTSEEAVGNWLRDQMVERQTTIEFQYQSTGTMNTEQFQVFCRKVVDIACDEERAETSAQGDYLRFHYGGYTARRTFEEGENLYYVTFSMVYYTDSRQEAELTARLSQVLGSLPLAGKNDYEKIKTIYGYICSHVTYDYSTAEGDYGKYTAYNALMKGTAVCQGYASLFHRMLRESGIRGRVITGTASSYDGSTQKHAWNIVLMNHVCYNMDSAWDAGHSAGNYRYFLQNMADFTNHTRSDGWTTYGYDESEDFTSTSFHARYPMAAESYHRWSITVTKESTCILEGLRNRICIDCGETHSGEVIPKSSHTPGALETKKASTCTEEGYQVRLCTRCGAEVERKSLPLKGHVYRQVTLKEATCTEKGSIASVCTACGQEEPGSRMSLNAKGHSFTAWITTQKATIFKAGSASRTCTLCQKKETKTLKKLTATVKLSTGSLYMQVGKTTTAVKVARKTAGDSVSYWKSSDSRVVLVNRKTGKIRARAAGKAYVSVVMKSGASARILIRVQRSPVKTKKLVLSKTTLTLKKGASFRLTVKRTPVTATDKLTYKSSDHEIARVTAGGTVKALKKGTATITVKAASGKWARCRVKISS